eukprot:11094323-Lingulodinium_polyedra.AAC.1
MIYAAAQRSRLTHKSKTVVRAKMTVRPPQNHVKQKTVSRADATRGPRRRGGGGSPAGRAVQFLLQHM